MPCPVDDQDGWATIASSHIDLQSRYQNGADTVKRRTEGAADYFIPVVR
jgi:hypothetical protein